MRKFVLLGLLCLLAAPGVAQDPAGDPVTAQVPAPSPMSARIASLERVDALAKELLPMLKACGLEQEVAPFAEVPPSNWFFAVSGLSGEIVDRSKPVYFAFSQAEEPVLIFHPAAGAAWEGKKELREENVAVLRGGAVVVGEPAQLQDEPRGAPTQYLGGDLAIHVYLSDLVTQFKEEIEQGAAMAAMQGGAAPGLTDAARALILPLVAGMKETVLACESFDCALTWKGERLESEGLLRFRARSGVRELLQRAGTPGQVDFAGFLPKDALLTWTASTNPDWPVKEIRTLLDHAAGGENAGGAIYQLLSFGSAFADMLTGRQAGCMSMSGMMGANASMLYELKEGTDPKQVLAKFDVEKMNGALKAFGLPVTVSFAKCESGYGDTDFYRLTMSSENPVLAGQLSMIQTFYAAEGRFLLTTSSPTAEDDLKGLLDTVRTGQMAETAHTAAMARLGKHNIGFTLNLGSLKPFGMMLGMFGAPQEAMQAIQAMPDVLPFSTAVTLNEGDIHWKGDWPVAEIAKIVEGVAAGAQKKEPAKEGEKDY